MKKLIADDNLDPFGIFAPVIIDEKTTYIKMEISYYIEGRINHRKLNKMVFRPINNTAFKSSVY